MPLASEEVYEDLRQHADMVQRHHERSKEQFRHLRETKWRRAYLYYHNCHDLSAFKRAVKKYPYESSVFVPTVYQQVEQAIPRYAAGALANDPLARLSPVIADPQMEDEHYMWGKALCSQAYLNQQLNAHVKIRRAFPIWARAAYLYGTAPLWVDWHTRRGPRAAPRMTAPDQWEVGVEEDVLLEDRIRVTFVDPWDLFPDPWGQSVNGENETRRCRFVQRQYILPSDEVWAWIEASPARGWLVDSPEQLKQFEGHIGEDGDFHRKMQVEVKELQDATGSGMAEPEDRRMVKVIQHCEHDRQSFVIGTKGNSRVLLYERGNRYPSLRGGIPLVLLKPTPKPNEFWGMSSTDAISGLVHQVNTLVNLRNVNLVRTVNGLLLVDTQSGLNSQQLQSQPHGMHDHDGTVPGDQIITEVNWPDLTSRIYEEVDWQLRHLKSTGGGVDFIGGQPVSGFRETARGIHSLIQQANARFTLAVQTMGEQLGDLVRTMHAVDLQHMTKSRYVRLMGEGGRHRYVPVDPDILNGEFEFKVDTRPQAADPQVQMQQFIEAVALVGGWPELNRSEAILELFKLKGVPRPRRFTNTQPAVPQLENQMFEATGEYPPARPSDAHRYHWLAHAQAFREDWTPWRKQAWRAHMDDHASYDASLAVRMPTVEAQRDLRAQQAMAAARGGGGTMAAAPGAGMPQGAGMPPGGGQGPAVILPQGAGMQGAPNVGAV